MGIFDFFNKTKEYEYEKRDIVYYNELGEETVLPLERYVEEVLNKSIRDNFNDANGLSEIILSAFDNDIYEPVEKAIKRLKEIDKSEKALDIDAIYNLKLKKYDKVILLYERFFAGEDYENISGTAHFNLARAYDELEDKRAIDEYKKAIHKQGNVSEIIEFYLQSVEKFKEKKKIEALEEISKYKKWYKPQLMYLEELLKQSKIGNVNISTHKDVISEYVKSILQNNTKIITLKKLANILLESDLLEDYEDYILPLYENEKDLDVIKQMLYFYIKKRNYEYGYNFIRKISLYDLKEKELEELVKYENILKSKRFVPEQKEERGFITYTKPLVYKFLKNIVNVDAQTEKQDKNMYIVPMYIPENCKDIASKYLNTVVGINSYIFEQIYEQSPINVKATYYTSKAKSLVFDQPYTSDYIYSIASNSPKIDYLVFGELNKEESTNIVNVNINIYNTRTGKVRKLSGGILNEEQNNYIIETTFRRLEQELNTKFESILFDKDEKDFQEKLFEYTLDYNNNNSYSLISQSLIFEKLINKYIETENDKKEKMNFIILLRIVGLLIIMKKSYLEMAKKYSEKLKNTSISIKYPMVLRIVEME